VRFVARQQAAWLPGAHSREIRLIYQRDDRRRRDDDGATEDGTTNDGRRRYDRLDTTIRLKTDVTDTMHDDRGRRWLVVVVSCLVVVVSSSRRRRSSSLSSSRSGF